MKKTRIILLLILTVCIIPVQSLNMAAVQQKSSIVVTGTSSLHDWEMKISNIQSTFKLDKISETSLEIADTRLSFRAENLQSDNSGLDKKAYEALKTDKHPLITFTQTGKLPVSLNSGNFKSKIKGNLSIAGTTKPVELNIEGTSQHDGSMRITGEVDMKMTDFGVTPPRAMLGAVRSGDAIKVKFDVNFQ
jgi:polyisoprenoid-binding protein YceI